MASRCSAGYIPSALPEMYLVPDGATVVSSWMQLSARIAKEGRGVLLYMRQEGRGIGLANKLKPMPFRIRLRHR